MSFFSAVASFFRENLSGNQKYTTVAIRADTDHPRTPPPIGDGEGVTNLTGPQLTISIMVWTIRFTVFLVYRNLQQDIMLQHGVF